MVMVQMTNQRPTLAEISYAVAARMFPDVPTPEETSSSLFVSQVDSAQRDYLMFLNRSMNDGRFSATHVISRRAFTVGIDTAVDDSSEWCVDPPNAQIAHRLLAESFLLDQSIFEDLSEQNSEPMRRLRRLIADCSGTYRKDGSHWRFTKIAELMQLELSEKRKRCSEKTIRTDLVQAAEFVEAQRRSGVKLPGLAQPKRAPASHFSGL